MSPSTSVMHDRPSSGGRFACVAIIVTAIFLTGWAVSSLQSPTDSAAPSTRSSQGPTIATTTWNGNFSHDRGAGRTASELIPPGRHPTVFTGHTDLDGNPITIACGTCHATRPPNFQTSHSLELDEFHRGLQFGHGSLHCVACHNPSDYDQLRLADGNSVAFEDVMQLCAQCHGLQAREFARGVHGGMNGHWDLSRGDRLRHNCTTCHDPHVPVIPRMRPTFKPRDRFLNGDHHQDGGVSK